MNDAIIRLNDVVFKYEDSERIGIWIEEEAIVAVIPSGRFTKAKFSIADLESVYILVLTALSNETVTEAVIS